MSFFSRLAIISLQTDHLKSEALEKSILAGVTDTNSVCRDLQQTTVNAGDQ